MAPSWLEILGAGDTEGLGGAWEGGWSGRLEGIRRKGLETGIRHFSSTWLSLSLKIKARPLLEHST